jgi:uncharacterized protein (DUF58 family)
MIGVVKKNFLKWRRYGQVYILPTQDGILFFILLFVLLVMGLGYQNNLILFIVFALVSLVVLMMVDAHFYLLNIRPVKIHIEDIHSGDSPLSTLYIEQEVSKGEVQIQIKDLKIHGVLKSEERIFRGRLSTTKRGVYDVSEVILSSTYPLGFFRVWSYHPLSVRFYVYPNRLKGEWNSFVLNENQHPTMTLNAGDEEFEQLKTWDPSIGLSRLDWKKLASKNQWLYADYRGLSGQNLWYQIPSFLSEVELSILAESISYTYEQNKTWRLAADEFDSGWGQGKEHYQICMRKLAGLRTSST